MFYLFCSIHDHDMNSKHRNPNPHLNSRVHQPKICGGGGVIWRHATLYAVIIGPFIGPALLGEIPHVIMPMIKRAMMATPAAMKPLS